MTALDSDDSLVFRINDYRGKVVVFTKKKLLEKQSDHPELHKAAFIACVKRALCEPDEVWQDYDDKRKRSYYKKYSAVSFAKAVVWIKSSPCQVVTAFEIDSVKESKYPGLKRIV